MSKPILLAFLTASIFVPTGGFAGPVQDAEVELRDAYSYYRVALFQSSAGKADETAKSLQDLTEKWDALSGRWSSAPPPQYADDAGLSDTLQNVDTVIAKAADEVAAGDLAKAHDTLEAIRSEIGDLHGRNGLIGFTDRMNAYHAEMEKVLEAAAEGDGMDASELRDAAAVLGYLAAEIVAHPAPESADPSYPPLVEAMVQSVHALLVAAESGDPAGVKAAIAGLKPAYAKLLAKFG